MESQGSRDGIALAAIAFTIVTWASSFAAIRVALAALTPVELAAARYTTAGLLAAAYLAVVRPPVPSFRDLARLALIGLLFVTGYSLFLNIGELTVKAGPASFILQINPILVALMAIPLLGERFGAWSWAATIISFAGIGLIALGGEGTLSFDFGAVLVFGSAVCAAVSSVLQKPMLARIAPLTVTAWLLSLGAVPFLPAAPGAYAALFRAPAEIFWAVVWLAVVPTVLGYATWAVALKRMPASRATNFLYCIPVVATAIGYVWIGEVPSPLALVGGALALAGVIGVNLARGR